MITIKLNDKEIKTTSGKTILDVATEHGIKIPTLCHDKELNPYGSCWVCAVEVKGRRGFVTACGTEVSDGMEILTNSEEVFSARKMALELLLSDHYADCEAPCKVACPDHVDIQTYVALIANGQYDEAVKVVKTRLPLPQSIGRVCPAFCEHECRRSIVDDPIAIRHLKRYAADVDAEKWNYNPIRKDLNGKKIAVVGAGPSGLTCGYYLSTEGFEVDIFESLPKPGGWLQYGIPEYRLPKEVLQNEINNMCVNGMKIHTNKTLGKDFSIADLRNQYDAIYLGIGASLAVPMRVAGSDLEGVMLGADFLREFALGNNPEVGKKVAIIGGGNTAVDCARTCKRMGSEVTIVYRRTRKEMPAESYEIDAADEEGIRFLMLTNPTEFIGEDGKLTKVKLEKMKLGEPDSSGRRRPEPTGEFIIEEFDTAIAAISQKPDVAFLEKDENKIDGENLALTRWNTAEVDEKTMYYNDKIFAGGDFRSGPATAIEAIADGRIAAEMIQKYTEGLPIELLKPKFDSKKAKSLKEVSAEEYQDYEVERRVKIRELDPQVRATNYEEVELPYNEEEAKQEAARCLECGCQVNDTCDLRKYSTDYDIDISAFVGGINKHPIDDSHPFIRRDANKCIKCGRCVRICSDVQGAGVLGYMYRGFKSEVAPEFGESLTETTCESCGKCIAVCPVGALTEKNVSYKLFPGWDEKIIQNCANCGTGCKIEITKNDKNIKTISTPENESFNGRNLCFKGRFGWQIFSEDRITKPLHNNNEISWNELPNLINERISNCESKQIFVGADVSNEEICMLKEIAKNIDAKISFPTNALDLTDEFLNDYKVVTTYKDLNIAKTIVIVGEISHTVRTLARTAQRNGAKLVVINSQENDFQDFADRLLIDSNIENAFDLYASEKDLKDPSTIYIYNRNTISNSLIQKVWNLAASHCDFSHRYGVLPTSNWANINGLKHFGIDFKYPKNSDFILLYGISNSGNVKTVTNDAKFVVSVQTHKTENMNEIVLPQASYLEMKGTGISDGGLLSIYKNPMNGKYIEKFLHLANSLNWIGKEKDSPAFWLHDVQENLDHSRVRLTKNDLDILVENASIYNGDIAFSNKTKMKLIGELKASTKI